MNVLKTFKSELCVLMLSSAMMGAVLWQEMVNERFPAATAKLLNFNSSLQTPATMAGCSPLLKHGNTEIRIS